MSASPFAETCPVQGKIIYATRAKAFDVCRKLNNEARRKRTQKQPPAQPYKCNSCHRFHVGRLFQGKKA